MIAPAQRARAADGVTVEWLAPRECSAALRVQTRIAEDLGGTRMPEADVTAVVTGEPGAWRAVLTVDGVVHIEREVTAPSCETLADAVALVTVVALDPFAITPPIERRVPPDPAPLRSEPRATEPVPPARAPEEPSVAPRRRSLPEAALRVEVGGSAFALPQPGAVLGLAPVVDVGRLRLELPVRWRVPYDEPAPRDVEVRMQQLTVGPRACGVPRRGAIGLLLCGGLDAGLVAARGRGAALAREQTAIEPWLAVTAAVGVRWRVNRRFATWAIVEGAVSALRPAFHVVEDGDVFESPPATLLVAIGGELRFPR